MITAPENGRSRGATLVMDPKNREEFEAQLKENLDFAIKDLEDALKELEKIRTKKRNK